MAYSKCKRMTVHAIGKDKDGNIEHGRNGNLGRCRNTEGSCGCIHAEIALLKKMPNPISVSVSHAPCLDCAKALVGAGVKTVTYLKKYRLTEGIQYLKDNGVFLLHVSGEWE